jgi:hypothetical protein
MLLLCAVFPAAHFFHSGVLCSVRINSRSLSPLSGFSSLTSRPFLLARTLWAFRSAVSFFALYGIGVPLGGLNRRAGRSRSSLGNHCVDVNWKRGQPSKLQAQRSDLFVNRISNGETPLMA